MTRTICLRCVYGLLLVLKKQRCYKSDYFNDHSLSKAFLFYILKNKQYVVLHSKYSITILAVYFNYHCLIWYRKFVAIDFRIVLLLSMINQEDCH